MPKTFLNNNVYILLYNTFTRSIAVYWVNWIILKCKKRRLLKLTNANTFRILWPYFILLKKSKADPAFCYDNNFTFWNIFYVCNIYVKTISQKAICSWRHYSTFYWFPPVMIHTNFLAIFINLNVFSFFREGSRDK